jgi:hypothetical protein
VVDPDEGVTGAAARHGNVLQDHAGARSCLDECAHRTSDVGDTEVSGKR